MKKRIISVFILVLAIFVLVGCGTQTKNLTLNNFIQAYTDASIPVDPNEKPLFQMIGAKDGVIFYIDRSKVAIYEYESSKALEDAKKEYEKLIKDWVSNDRFLLETEVEQAREIFNGV